MVGQKHDYNNPRLRVSSSTNENRFPNAHIKNDTIWCDSADILESVPRAWEKYFAEDVFIDFVIKLGFMQF